nr:7-cyano-7-deazaguanine synthase [Bradyrhizobium sp. SZCCHNR1020]
MAKASDVLHPNTFVPGRNLLFFTLAAAVADRRGDTSTCSAACARPPLQVANLGMDQRFVLHTR